MDHQASQIRSDLLQDLHRSAPGLLEEFPISHYLSELKSHKGLLNATSYTGKQTKRLSRIKENYGIAGIAGFQKLALASLIDDFLSNLDEKSYPETIRSLYIAWFERVYEDFTTQSDFYYDIENEFWPVSHDLGICSGRTIPVGGAWFIERRILPRKTMTFLAQEWSQKIKLKKKISHKSPHKSLAKILKNIGIYEAINRLFAFSPKVFGGSWCYLIHTAGRNIKDFNAENMNLAYKNIVELLKTDQIIWGVFRESWFLDPDLKEISPNLSFLWETPLQKGARLYYGGPCNEYDLKRALLLSPIRNKMYHEGKYIPETYFYFWPRQEMIEGCSAM